MFIYNSRENERMLEFAHAVQQKLNQYKADDATMGEVRRRIVIVFDCFPSVQGRRQGQIDPSAPGSRFRRRVADASRIDLSSDGS